MWSGLKVGGSGKEKKIMPFPDRLYSPNSIGRVVSSETRVLTRGLTGCVTADTIVIPAGIYLLEGLG